MNSLLRNTRTLTAILLLTGIFLLSICSAALVRRSCDRLLKCTDAAIYVLDTMDKDHAAGEIGALTRCWEQNRGLLRLMLPAQPMTELNEAILRLDALDAVQSDELLAELHAVRADLLWIRRSAPGGH